MECNEMVKLIRRFTRGFSHVSEKKIEELIKDSELETFVKGEFIFEYHTETPAVYIILKGEAQVSLIRDSGRELVFDHFHPGELLGEITVITGNTAYATVTATEDCFMLKISKDRFKQFLSENPATLAVAVQCLGEKIRRASIERLSTFKDSSTDPYGFDLHTPDPQKILVINCGSSSLKYTLFDTKDRENIADGQVDRIGTSTPMGLSYSYGSVEREKEIAPGDHKSAFDAILAELTSKDHGCIASPDEITAVGHRVVHGGDTFNQSTLLTPEVIEAIENISNLAPLHNPVNLVGIRESQRVFPQAAQVAVFDTAYHQTIPPQAFLYGLPYEYYTEKKIRRYGFHGTSHYYVSLKASEYFKRPYKDLNIISCHLGNGGSVCAIEHGKSVDTSMGLTPAEGIVMGTRAGSIDPAALLHLMQNEGMSVSEVNDLINKKSGLLGLSGISNDMRDITAAVKKGDPRATIAFKTFAYSIKRYVGSYTAVLGKVDAIVFTGGIGLYTTAVRREVCRGLEPLGIHIDEEKCRRFNGCKVPVDIATDDSPVKILIIPTNEELMIARETISVIYSDLRAENRMREDFSIPLEVSARHIHLTEEHIETLFGSGYKLHNMAELSQPGQYACEEQVKIIGPKKSFEKVRVLGPARRATQLEISKTDAIALGIDAKIRESGKIAGTSGVTIVGPAGSVTITEGVIVAKRHIHMTPEDATEFGVEDNQVVSVRFESHDERDIVFGDVVVRVSENFRLAMHIDTDEGNAAAVKNGDRGYLVY